MIRLPARSLSPRAREWLRRHPRGEVLSVHRRACNLRAPDGEVLSLVQDRGEAGPFSVVLSGTRGNFDRWVHTGDPVTVDGPILAVGSLQVDARRARVWDPRPDWARLRATRSTWARLLPGLMELTRREAPAGGLVGCTDARPDRSLRRRVTGVLRGRTLALQAALAGPSGDPVERSAADLAGLGPGLTPAGDDYLVGAMLALWASLAPAEADRWSARIAAAATPRTTTLSAAWLRASARGEADAAWHALVEALASADAPAVAAAGRKVLQRGHTSGGDALAGFLETLDRGSLPTAPARAVTQALRAP